MFKKSKEKNKVEYGRNEGSHVPEHMSIAHNEDSHTPQNKEVVQLIRDITGGFILPLKSNHDYVVVIRDTKTLVFNVVGERIYLSGSMLGKDFAYADNKNNPVSIEVVKLIAKSL